MNGYGSTSHVKETNGSSQVDNVLRTKILLLGLRRSGKSSIQEFLFNNLAPKQTFYLDMTTQIKKNTYDTVIPLEIWDCPGNINIDTLEVPLAQFSTIIFVVDIQDNLGPPLTQFVQLADALSEEYKMESRSTENFRHIQQRVLDDLLDESTEYEQIGIDFHLTSIYDHSIHEAFSRVLHKLIGSLAFLEDLMNVFVSNSQSSKAFLFDIKSRLYVATDASPVDSQTHSLCNDYLNMLNSFGPLYRSATESPIHKRVPSMKSSTSTPIPSNTASPSGPLSPSTSASHTPTVHDFPLPPPSPGVTKRTTPHQTPVIGTQPSAHPPHSAHNFRPNSSSTLKSKQKQLFYPSASTTLSPTSPNSGTTLTYHQITKHLALLTLIPNAVWESRRGLLEYNVVFFREGVQEICDVEDEMRRSA
ncbi:GTP-binding protein [Abortiporus biennis]